MSWSWMQLRVGVGQIRRGWDQPFPALRGLTGQVFLPDLCQQKQSGCHVCPYFPRFQALCATSEAFFDYLLESLKILKLPSAAIAQPMRSQLKIFGHIGYETLYRSQGPGCIERKHRTDVECGKSIEWCESQCIYRCNVYNIYICIYILYIFILELLTALGRLWCYAS